MRYAVLAAILGCIFVAGCGGGLKGQWRQEARIGVVTLEFGNGDIKIETPSGEDHAKYKIENEKITITRLGAGEGEKTYDFKLEGDTLTIAGFYGDGVYQRVKK